MSIKLKPITKYDGFLPDIEKFLRKNPTCEKMGPIVAGKSSIQVSPYVLRTSQKRIYILRQMTDSTYMYYCSGKLFKLYTLYQFPNTELRDIHIEHMINTIHDYVDRTTPKFEKKTFSDVIKKA